VEKQAQERDHRGSAYLISPVTPARTELWNGPPLYPAAYADRTNRRGKSMTMQIAVLGIDLGKNSSVWLG
jgi:hypothetical protein